MPGFSGRHSLCPTVTRTCPYTIAHHQNLIFFITRGATGTNVSRAFLIAVGFFDCRSGLSRDGDDTTALVACCSHDVWHGTTTIIERDRVISEGCFHQILAEMANCLRFITIFVKFHRCTLIKQEGPPCCTPFGSVATRDIINVARRIRNRKQNLQSEALTYECNLSVVILQQRIEFCYRVQKT